MQRRHLLKLGIASAATLTIIGAAVALVQPSLEKSRLSERGRSIFKAVGAAVLNGSLPKEPKQQAIALSGLLQRVDILIGNLPPHAQAEISQLLAVLGTSVGRRGLAGLSEDWKLADIAKIQAALQSMRLSSVAMRQQTYHALHDIVGGAYFSDASTWSLLGYPGPLKI